MKIIKINKPKTSAEISANWRKNNPERYKELYKKYYKERHTEILENLHKFRKNNPNYFKTPSQVGYRATPEGWSKYKVNSLKYQAKKRGLEINITYLDILPLIVEYCPILGIKLNYGILNGKTKMANDSPSIDRIDNTKGYIKGNIVIISNLANRVKSTLTLDELPAVLTKIIDYYKNEKYKI